MKLSTKTHSLIANWTFLLGPVSCATAANEWDRISKNFTDQYHSRVVQWFAHKKDLYFLVIYNNEAAVGGAVANIETIQKPFLKIPYIYFGVSYSASQPWQFVEPVGDFPIGKLIKKLLRILKVPFAVWKRAEVGDIAVQSARLNQIYLPTASVWKMDLKGVHSLEGYINRFPAKRRKKLRRILKYREEKNLSYRVNSIKTCSTKNLGQLADQVAQKYGRKNSEMNSYLKNIQGECSDLTKVFQVFRGDKMIAFDLLCEAKNGTRMEIPIVGFDYEEVRNLPIYEILYLFEVDYFSKTKNLPKVIDIGQGAARIKRRLGAVESETCALIYTKIPGITIFSKPINLMLRRILSVD